MSFEDRGINMCFPNEPDELERIMRDSRVVDWFIEELTRSPRAGGEQSSAPSLPAAGVGYVDSRQEPTPAAAPAPLKFGSERTPHQLKKLREAARSMRLKYKEQPQQQNWFTPKPPPYDDVYEAGVAWLDGLAGESFRSEQLTVEFDRDSQATGV